VYAQRLWEIKRGEEGKRSRPKVKGQAKGTYFIQGRICDWAGIVLSERVPGALGPALTALTMAWQSASALTGTDTGCPPLD